MRIKTETLVVGSLIFILIVGLIRIALGKKGTWSNSISAPKKQPITLSTNESAGEQRTRAFLERYFDGYKFNKARPDFLNNAVTGQNLELDCYNAELNLAVEYNGRQHYQYIPYFHANKEAFYNQKYRDELKKMYCHDNGVRLISVPYTEKNIETFLYRKIKELYGD